jgi:LPXTG-motif cell wall-anchored protein
MAMDGFYVYNTGALEIGTISAGGSVVLTATGSITAAASGSAAPNVTGNTLSLTSGGSIGQSARPLLLDVGSGLTVTGGNLYLVAIGNLPVENVTGDVVVLTVGGVVKVVPGGGTITARELLIQAFGDIGTKDQPISIVVGKTTIGTTLGLVYTYVPSSGGRGGLKPGPGTGTIGVPYTGGTSEIGWLFVAVGLLGLALVLKKRRHA